MFCISAVFAANISAFTFFQKNASPILFVYILQNKFRTFASYDVPSVYSLGHWIGVCTPVNNHMQDIKT